jgi:hypothetical protein
MLNRREFLISATAVAAVMQAARIEAQAAKLARVGVSSANFAGVIKLGVGPEPPSPSRTLDFLDLPQMLADKFGVHNIEVLHSQFVSTEASYLKDLKDRLAKAKSTIVQINTDFQGGTVSAGGFSQRAQGIDLAKAWIAHAETLGCPRVLVSPGALAEANRASGVDGLKILSAYGKARKVSIVLDNRDDGAVVAPPAAPPAPPAGAAAGAAGAPAQGRGGGGGGRGGGPVVPVNWQALAEVIKAAGINACPDPGGFPNDAERAAGLKALYALSDGNSRVRMTPKVDLAATVKASKDAAYKGLYTIVADGEAGTKAALDALLKLI